MKALVLVACLTLAILAQQLFSHTQDITLTPANVIRVYDGDTITVDLPGQLDVFGENIGVRLLGIDTPELVSKCPTQLERDVEKAKALIVKQFLINSIQAGKTITLSELDRDKYFRLLSRVLIDDVDIGQVMITKGLADPYDGGTKLGWCGR